MSTRNAYHAELDEIQNKLVAMANCVEGMIDRAMDALQNHVIEQVEKVFADDDIVDDIDIWIEKSCTSLIALQQPAARDLRFIGSALKISTDIERIGDHAVDIAKIARKLDAMHATVDVTPLSNIKDKIRHMLHDAVQAFLRHDVALLDKVIRDDDEIDALYMTFTATTTRTMSTANESAVACSYLLFAVHHLERIADHIVNIAERVGYVETGAIRREETLRSEEGAES